MIEKYDAWHGFMESTYTNKTLSVGLFVIKWTQVGDCGVLDCICGNEG